MNKVARTFLIAAFATLLFVTGCLAPPKRHAWEITRPDAPALQGAHLWEQLPTNQYARVSDTACTNAVRLLQLTPFVHLDSSQVSLVTPALQGIATGDMQPYLVRGVAYLQRPSFTIVRFDNTSRSVFVQQFTWNGEMLMPFRWVAEPNALVVFLPAAPEHVYPEAILGGDGIFRGRRGNTLDMR